LIYEHPSKIDATAKMVEGEISEWLLSIDFNKESAVPCTL
jgi:hypothetical protein